MIIDTFMFNDEFEMLDIRLDISNNYVDKWIILEGNRTWSGKEKPYHLAARIDEYQQKYNNKIQLINLDIPADYKDWKCENFSRASLQAGIDLYDANDVVIHSDLDEILDPEKIQSILDLLEKENKPVNCTLDMFIFKFDQKLYRTWSGPVVAKKCMFNTPQELYKGDQYKKKNRSHCVVHPGIIGWHWTWIGNDDRIKNKVESCIESQYRDPNEVLDALKKQDTKLAINHKCETQYVDYKYPKSVFDVIFKFPYWTTET